MSEKELPSVKREDAQPDNGAQNDEGAAQPNHKYIRLRPDGTPFKQSVSKRPSTYQIKSAIEKISKAYVTKEEELKGKSIAELAKEFDLTEYRKSKGPTPKVDVIKLAREVISEKLLPKALAVLNKELNAGNYAAAKDVLSGLQVLEKGGKSVVEHVSKSSILDTVRGEIIDTTPMENKNVTDDESH